MNDRIRLDTERRRHAIAGFDGDPEYRRPLRHPGKRQPPIPPLEIDRCGSKTEAEDDAVVARREVSIVGERKRRSDRRMTRKRHLAVRAENPHAKVGAALFSREDERRFRKVHFARDARHVVRREAGGIGEDRELIPGERGFSEDVVVQVAVITGCHG